MYKYSWTKALTLLSFIFITGCAHNIQINPDLNSLRTYEASAQSNLNVAYFISEMDRKKQVTTPGGGGDKVTYKPYADSEAALNTVLLKIFNRVYSLKTLSDKDYIKQNDISYIFVPNIKTNSSSSSMLTWPPTEFDIDLSIEAYDSEGSKIWNKKISSKGTANSDEFKGDFSLSARRSSEDLFKQLLEEIVNSQSFELDN